MKRKIEDLMIAFFIIAVSDPIQRHPEMHSQDYDVLLNLTHALFFAVALSIPNLLPYQGEHFLSRLARSQTMTSAIAHSTLKYMGKEIAERFIRTHV
jgi:hypothetical protein